VIVIADARTTIKVNQQYKLNLLIDILGIIGKMQFNLFETRFKSKICGKVFTTKALLNKHCKEEHNK
jgi:hypothetical protein